MVPVFSKTENSTIWQQEIIHLPLEISGVSCYLFESEHDKGKNFKAGDEMEIKGMCTGYLVDVVIVKSVIANSLTAPNQLSLKVIKLKIMKKMKLTMWSSVKGNCWPNQHLK